LLKIRRADLVSSFGNCVKCWWKLPKINRNKMSNSWHRPIETAHEFFFFLQEQGQKQNMMIRNYVTRDYQHVDAGNLARPTTVDSSPVSWYYINQLGAEETCLLGRNLPRPASIRCCTRRYPLRQASTFCSSSS
jgi:hypothetical protein